MRDYISREGHCEAPDCQEKIDARRLCKKHYKRMMKSGSLEAVPRGRPRKPVTETVVQRATETCLNCGGSMEGTRTQAKACSSKCASRISWLKTKYGISPAEYDAMYSAQSGRCLLCGSSGPLVVDHCHNTGSVRALLCDFCNKGLGFFRDNPDVLLKAAEFMRKAG